jgi:hypothetical protein
MSVPPPVFGISSSFSAATAAAGCPTRVASRASPAKVMMPARELSESSIAIRVSAARSSVCRIVSSKSVVHLWSGRYLWRTLGIHSRYSPTVPSPSMSRPVGRKVLVEKSIRSTTS